MHAQLCLTLCDPMDCSLPGSSVHGIIPARILEWVAISFSKGSSRPRDRTMSHWQVDSLPLCHLGSPLSTELVAKNFCFAACSKDLNIHLIFPLIFAILP